MRSDESAHRGGGGSRPPLGPRTRLGLAPWLIVGVAAVVVAGLAGVSATIAVCLAALATSALAVGFHFGDRGRATLEHEVEGRTSELKRALSELEIAQAETVRRLSMAVEFRDEDTGAHIERIGRFSMLLAKHIGMDDGFCERLRHAAPLHDVGKVAIPDAILLKPGPLTTEERAIVETHAEEGHRLVRGSSSSILDMAATIALSHQEKWDGSGYPRGLTGEAIPIEGRIVAVADVFDALTSDRVYRKAYSVEDAIQMMREQRGRHFDPILLDAFMEVLGETGPDAREQADPDPAVLVETTLETFAGALERGDAETAEGAIATAIEGGITPTTLHAEVIAPSLRRIRFVVDTDELTRRDEGRAETITRRVLATLHRYMTVGAEPTRESVLVVVLHGDRHGLGVQMVHDQLAAAGFRAQIETSVRPASLATLLAAVKPRALVLGPAADHDGGALEAALAEVHTIYPELPVVLCGPAVGGGVSHDGNGVLVLERIDETVNAVAAALAPAPSTASV